MKYRVPLEEDYSSGPEDFYPLLEEIAALFFELSNPEETFGWHSASSKEMLAQIYREAGFDYVNQDLAIAGMSYSMLLQFRDRLSSLRKNPALPVVVEGGLPEELIVLIACCEELMQRLSLNWEDERIGAFIKALYDRGDYKWPGLQPAIRGLSERMLAALAGKLAGILPPGP